MNDGRRAGGSGLEVRLLGSLEVLEDGRPVAVGGPKQRMLLGVLALEPGRVVSVDRLVESLWPGEPPGTAAHAIQVYVSQLRKALGSDVIATRAPGYVLELGADGVDAHSFAGLVSEGRETLAAGDPASASSLLRDALALWRGPALADFTYEPFAQTEIARLEELRAVAIEERIEADLALGRHVELVSELDALVQSQPLRERPRGQLMLALYRAGRQSDALAAYRAARETLVAELGIEPGPELRKLEAAILRQDESLLPAEGDAAPAMQFRRLVTILFVDVVESMALAAALDAEALGRVLSGYFETVSAVLTRHGGTVEKYAGDAVMAVFGIPISHEDDALRAARAALDIQTAVAALNERLEEAHGVGLEIRIGVESGEIVTTPTEMRQRLVTGEAVGVASRLEQAAGANEIVLGELAARLIDHAARLESLGELEIKGKREPVRAFRLVELEVSAPAFGRRLDAALVGRKRELAALRRGLKKSIDASAVRAVVLIGTPGVGKSRLAAELGRRAKGVTALRGRCLSYGEGITYWPLREVVEKVPESEERDAILGALDADTPPPAPEIAWRFRKLCESLAREQPVLIVFDDVHWAEPTFLELVEHLADKGEGAILVVCVAREELLEDRPRFLEGRKNVEQIALDALSAEETEALLDGLGGAVLETDQRHRIAETAEGNPLFLEQLLALALEGGLAERQLPETIQSLLAARLDRLGPGERAVLERGSIVLRSFTHDDVVALLEPEAAPSVGTHLQTLIERGFLRPVDDALRFRHAVVQDVVYRAAPKRLRAELHERFADCLETTASDLAELDEFVGYHLERAYTLRTELGESDRRTARLAEDGGHRLGAAGIRALKRGDMHASVNLFGRATSLLPPGDAHRRTALCDLGLTLYAAGDPERALASVARAIDESRTVSDRRVEAWARIEYEYMLLQQEPQKTADDVLRAADDGIPVLESSGEHRPLARAWVLAGWARGGRRGDHGAWLEAAERALVHYKAGAWSTSTCLGQIAAALYWGATPVTDAITRCEALLRDEVSDRAGHAYVLAFLGGLVAQRGDLERARALVGSARTTLEELGLHTPATTYCSPVLGEIELLSGNADDAEQIWRDLCEELERTHQLSRLSSTAAELAEALAAQGRFDEAFEWTEKAMTHTAPDDLHAQMRWGPIRALMHARRGELKDASVVAHRSAEIAASTDDLNRAGRAQLALSEVMCLTGGRDSRESVQTAIELFERKGNTVAAARARDMLTVRVPG